MGKILGKERKFAEERARIYAAEILLALEDLHKRDIIYRDLKPDNVVIDEEGRATITHPCIVIGYFNHANMRGKLTAGIFELRRRDSHGHLFKLADGNRCLRVGFLGRFGTHTKSVRALRPKHPTAVMLLEFCWHTETVFVRGAV